MPDIIYTTRPTDYASFIASDLGITIGCNSSDSRIVNNKHRYEWAFKIDFIDNPYKNYNHNNHLGAIKEIQPKYATVRDVMTSEQCKKDKIEYYPFEQILDWAYEISEYTQNVIIIPKYDCLEKIPGQFMLGYSVPTRHGGTELDISLFSDWDVHLLGGNPRKQIELCNQNSNVVSLDNNYIEFIAQRGKFITPDLKERKIESLAGFDVKQHRLVCLALSFNAIVARFGQQRKTGKKVYIPKGQLQMF